MSEKRIRLSKKIIREELDKVTKIYTDQEAIYFMIGVLEAHGYTVEVIEYE